MVEYFVTIKAKDFDKNMKGRAKRLRQGLQKLTKKTATDGADYAAKIAPRQTGALISGIKSEPDNSGGTKNNWRIVSLTPPNRGRNNPKHKPYHWFLHMGMRGWYKGSTKTGMHNYMDVTAGWVRRSIKDNAKRTVRKSIK